jgi:hypothetical protein
MNSSSKVVTMKRFLRLALPVLCGIIFFAASSAIVNAATIARSIAAGSDDAEEFLEPPADLGVMSLTSSDLELHSDGPPNDRQWVGMRFTNISIPRGAPITSASVQFTTDAVDTDDTPGADVRIYGELAPNSATFEATNFNLTNRPRTSSSVDWMDIPLWPTVGAAGPDQRTPNLASIIQQIVNQPGWTSGNALSILIEPIGGATVATGANERTAGSFETDVAGSAPARLTIEFIPEPTSCLLAATAVCGLGVVRRRRGQVESPFRSV